MVLAGFSFRWVVWLLMDDERVLKEAELQASPNVARGLWTLVRLGRGVRVLVWSVDVGASLLEGVGAGWLLAVLAVVRQVFSSRMLMDPLLELLQLRL